MHTNVPGARTHTMHATNGRTTINPHDQANATASLPQAMAVRHAISVCSPDNTKGASKRARAT